MIIVTGGSGFIGSNLVALLEQHYEGDIVVCDYWLNDKKWLNISKRSISKLIFPENIFDFLANKKIDTIFHMGAISSTTFTNVKQIIQKNILFSQNLFEWCANNDVRLIYASSAATYGSGAQGFIDGLKLPHLKQLNPLNLYGWSKHFFDKFYAMQAEKGHKLPSQCVGLKFFNVYGPNEYHKARQLSVVWQAYQQIKHNKEVKLFKSNNVDYQHGEQLRDFIYVKDCCNIILWLWQNPQINGLFNVGTGKARTFIDLAKAVFHNLHQTINIDYIDLPSNLASTYQYYTQADLTLLRNTGYKQEFTSLEQGIAEYINIYLNNSDSYL